MDRELNATCARCYCLISPCRDEAKFMRRTLDSVLGQTVRPALWVIVDDGSTDATPEILAEYAAKHECIRVVRREDRGKRSVGPGVIDAFYAGYETIEPGEFDYICKLDLDLDLPAGYFERLMAMMQEDPRLGSASGKAYYIDKVTSQTVLEKISDEMSVGASKFYRRTCLEQIGVFVREVMWDGIDCHRCRLLGWKAGSFDEAGLRFEHLRPMGSSDRGILKGRMRHGYGQYFMGSSVVYVLASAVFRLWHPPRVLGSVAMMWGYLRAWVTRKPRYDDAVFRRFLRKYQWQCLLRGKRRATAEVDEKQAEAWRPTGEAKPAAAYEPMATGA